MVFKKLIPQKLIELRKIFSYSQEEMAKTLWVDRVVYGNIESWKREIKVEELKKLADFFQIQIEYFFSESLKVADYKINKEEKDDVRISIPEVKIDKFKEVLLYILDKIWAKPNFCVTVLHKILYFCDFDYYETYEEFFVGGKYIKNDFWPTSKELIKIVSDMKNHKEIDIEKKKFSSGNEGIVYKPLRKADLTKITGAEKEVLDNVLSRLWDMSSNKIKEYSHGDLPWYMTPDKKEIPYESVFYRTAQYSVRDYPEEND